jgi:hypothetical protein
VKQIWAAIERQFFQNRLSASGTSSSRKSRSLSNEATHLTCIVNACAFGLWEHKWESLSVRSGKMTSQLRFAAPAMSLGGAKMGSRVEKEMTKLCEPSTSETSSKAYLEMCISWDRKIVCRVEKITS